MRILLKKTKKNSFLEFYPLYFTLFTSKTPDLNEKIQDFFDLLLINKENHLLVFSFINDLAKILLDSSNLPETPYFLINYLPYYILTLSHSNSFSIQAENPLSTTFHNLFLLLSKTSLNPSPYLKLFILNDSNTMKKALDFDQIQINQLIKEIIPTSYFNLVQSFFLLKDVNNLIIKEGSSFENPNITHSNLLIVIEALKKVHPAFQGVSYYKDSLNFLLQELENKAFLIKIYNELESLKGNCLIKLLEASKTLDFIEKTVGVKEKGMKYSLEGFSIVEIAPELLKLQNALISMLIPFEKQNPLVLSNLFYSLLAKILSSIENPSFGGVFSIGEEYFGVLQGDYEGGGINEVELQIKRQIPL